MTAAPDSQLATLWCPSPNRDQRANGRAPDMLTLHYTGMESSDAALDWLTREEAKVSAHYLIDEEGRIAQIVAESERAWWSGVVSAAAYRAASPIASAANTQAAPLAQLIAALGPPVTTAASASVVPHGLPWWLLAVILAAIVAEIASRRLRGAP